MSFVALRVGSHQVIFTTDSLRTETDGGLGSDKRESFSLRTKQYFIYCHGVYKTWKFLDGTRRVLLHKTVTVNILVKRNVNPLGAAVSASMINKCSYIGCIFRYVKLHFRYG